MAISGDSHVIEPYRKKDGSTYDKVMLSSKHVEMGDGENLENRLIGMPYILQGTYVADVSGTSHGLFGLEWLRENFKQLYGLSQTSDATYRYCVLVMNGDGNAHSFHVEGTTWINGTCYAVWKDSITAHVRFNYVVFYLDNDCLRDD